MMEIQQINPAALTTLDPGNVDFLVNLVRDSVDSLRTKELYEADVRSFLSWYILGNYSQINKSVLNKWKGELIEEGYSSSTVNVRLSAVKKMVTEVADNNLGISQDQAAAICRVKSVSRKGTRMHNWLSKKQAQQLLLRPDASTLKGCRDRCALAILIGSGLRCQELSDLTFNHIQIRDARAVIVDIVGKGNRVRSIPINSWVHLAINKWEDELTDRNETDKDYVIRPMNKGGKVFGHVKASRSTIYRIVSRYADDGIAPHDLRRTFAKLSLAGGARIEQISLSLGHSSIETTQRYLGVELDLQDSPSDRIRMRIE